MMRPYLAITVETTPQRQYLAPTCKGLSKFYMTVRSSANVGFGMVSVTLESAQFSLFLKSVSSRLEWFGFQHAALSVGLLTVGTFRRLSPVLCSISLSHLDSQSALGVSVQLGIQGVQRNG